MTVSFSGSDRREAIRVIFFGDSITQGAGVGSKDSFVALSSEMLRNYNINATIVNLGVPGEQSDEAVVRLRSDVIAQAPDIVVVMYGANDAFVDERAVSERLPLEAYKRNMSNIVRQLIDENITVILMTPTPFGKEFLAQREPYKSKGLAFHIKPYISACREIAENHQVMLCDNYLLWEEKERLGHDIHAMLPDGRHPDAAGHAEIARLLFPKLLQACCNLPSHEVLIEEGLCIRTHHQAELKNRGNALEVSGVFGYLYANFIPGKGDFSVEAQFRVDRFNQAEPSFVLGDSEFSFYDEGKSLAISGLFSGYRNTSIAIDSAGVDPGEWMRLVISRHKHIITLRINDISLQQCFYQDAFTGKTGFKPGKARLHVRNFTITGNLLPVSIVPKSFTVPLVDLSQETSRQVVVDREREQYLGHPTTVLLEDNQTMYAVYPKGHGGGALVLKKSVDAGLTWSERQAVPDNWATSREVPTIYRTIDKNGTKRLVIFSGLYPIRMTVSDDDGETWTPLEPVFSYGGIVTLSDMARRINGDYIAFFHDDGKYFQREGKKTNRFFVFKTVSSDGGLTWSDPEVVTHHKSAHLCEGGFITSPDGAEWALLLRENSRKYNSMIVFSSDEGEHWTPPVELPASLTGDRHQLLYAPDGRIVAVFRDMAALSPTKGDFAGWVGTWDDLKTGAEGQCRLRLMKNTYAYDCGYPGFELLPDGTFVATTYGHWIEGESPFIVSVRFTMEDIDDRLQAEMKSN